MHETEFGLIEKELEIYPNNNLLGVSHKNGKLKVGFPAFGPFSYIKSLELINKVYSHPKSGKPIKFRLSLTSEVISSIAYEFGDGGEIDAKKKYLDPNFVFLGPILLTDEGVFTNTIETNDKNLKELLIEDRKCHDIYLLDNGVGFAPFNTFKTGSQHIDTFIRGGLARVLEYTHKEIALQLKEIVSPKLYNGGVNIVDYNSKNLTIDSPISVIYSNKDPSPNILELSVFNNNQPGGYTFGTLDSSISNK